jgi:hypothetical protein
MPPDDARLRLVIAAAGSWVVGQQRCRHPMPFSSIFCAVPQLDQTAMAALAARYPIGLVLVLGARDGKFRTEAPVFCLEPVDCSFPV